MTKHELTAVEPLTEAIKVVVIAAHPDDIEFGGAGTVARWIQEGAEVTYVLVTDGSAGSNEPNIDLNALIETRQQEQIAAAEAVGVKDVRFLGYQDGVLEATMELRKDLTRILREVKPDRVICQDPTTIFYGDNYINHPDHRAAGEAAIYATFPSSETRPIFPELLDEGYEPHKVKELWINLSQKPTHYVDVTGVFDKKVDALRAHVSQLGAGEEFDNGVLKYITERATNINIPEEVRYAEYFKVMTLSRANEDVRDKDLEKAGTQEA